MKIFIYTVILSLNFSILAPTDCFYHNRGSRSKEAQDELNQKVQVVDSGYQVEGCPSSVKLRGN